MQINRVIRLFIALVALVVIAGCKTEGKASGCKDRLYALQQ